MDELLLSAFEQSPLSITADQAQSMARYHALLTDASRRMNLTAVQSMRDAATLHYLDSASPLFFDWIAPNSRCADVGTGAGFPGVVLAILRPDCSFMLMDSLSKRVRFLRDALESLGIRNARAMHIRAEDAGQNPLRREQYDVVLSRAVAPMPVLCEYCLPLVKVGGLMIAYKGPAAAQEMEDAKQSMRLLGAGDHRIEDAGIPGRSHKLIRIEKARPTPKEYPRKTGMPAKAPLQ